MPTAFNRIGAHALRSDAQSGRVACLGRQLKPAAFPEAHRLRNLDHHAGKRPCPQGLFGNGKTVNLAVH